ncbi:MAG TPA: hypothetical protein VEA80_11985 [Vitreimonas sp.]|uniref:hypothetical protein n=1 Tax=Vitreimonas sp. TaxID=3069702 RepID=UPI002D505CA3|nr:hypothetical protein [Vitreimonas sp.]HYD88190.1 hypothetical protein [Vitreimonas sp.]
MFDQRSDAAPRETASVRRDAWRAQLLQEQVAEEMAQRRHAAAMRAAVTAGVLFGLIGSVALAL